MAIVSVLTVIFKPFEFDSLLLLFHPKLSQTWREITPCTLPWLLLAAPGLDCTCSPTACSRRNTRKNKNDNFVSSIYWKSICTHNPTIQTHPLLFLLRYFHFVVSTILQMRKYTNHSINCLSSVCSLFIIYNSDLSWRSQLCLLTFHNL